MALPFVAELQPLIQQNRKNQLSKINKMADAN